MYRGPISFRSWVKRLSAEGQGELRRLERDHPAGRSMALFWTDGVRSLAEVSGLVALEYLVGCFGYLEGLGCWSSSRGEAYIRWMRGSFACLGPVV